MTNLDILIQEIFVDSFRTFFFQDRLWHLSPFNATKIKREINVEVEKVRKKQVPYSTDVLGVLDNLSREIKQAGGITRGIYEQYGFALNAIARELTDTNRSIPGARYFIPDEDRKSAEISEKFRSIPDGEYGECAGSYSYTNIFDSNYKEGTLFQRDYEGDNLTTFRIFHQMHRASLLVGTVDIKTLEEEVDKIIKVRDTKIEIDTDLPYDEDTFAYEKIPEFNGAFGEALTLNVFSIGNNYNHPIFIIEFKQSRAELAKIFSGFDVPLSVYSDDVRLTLRKGARIDSVLDFYDRAVIDRHEPQHFRLDTTDDKVQTYLILGNSVPDFFVPMLKSYIRTQIDE